MLVRITDSCRMGCRHCMVDARPDGGHMTLDTFRDVLRFTLDHSVVPIMLVSGGEPTDHPDILRILHMARDRGIHTTLLSNGMFLHEDPAMRDALLQVADVVQVTNDPRFYPRHVPDFGHPSVHFERSIRMVSPFGRAKVAGLECNRISPLCFNLRSAVSSTGDLVQAMWALRVRGKMCSPSINVDGSLVAGEAPSCMSFGRVTDDDTALIRNILAMRCNRCGLVDNLSAEYRAIIGEPDGSG